MYPHTILFQMFQKPHFGWTYCQNGTIQAASIFNIILGTIVYLLSKITNQYSWVDRVWTIIPIGYATHFIIHPLNCTKQNQLPMRSLIMTVLITMWGLRLTFNFWRKGGYKKGGEDHRWPFMRKKWAGIRMELLLFFFISYYQPFLIMWFTLPVYYVSTKDLALLDYILVFAAIAALMLEKISDDQQWQYQTQKRIQLNNNKATSQPPQVYKNGFITTGLFRYSRHPNFVGELSFWWVIALFSVADIGLNLSTFGALQLTLLFQGSTRLTQQISVLKYPLYKAYQKNVPMLLPQFSAPEDVLQGKKE